MASRDTETLRVIPAVQIHVPSDPAELRERFEDHFRHDINAILQSLQGKEDALDRFLEEREDTGLGMPHEGVVALRKTTRLIRGATNALVKIVSDIDRRKETVERVYQPVGSILEEVVFAVIDEASGVKCTIEDNGVFAEIDREQVWRAVFNLVNNAYRILKEKLAEDKNFKPAMRISGRNRTENIEICVEDNGPGIPDSARTKIFTVGYTTQDGQQHGFGLNNVRRICILHGGDVAFESKLGDTKFTMTLPKGSPESGEIPVLKDRLIFIVEDDAVVAGLLQAYLEEKDVEPNNIVMCNDLESLIKELKCADTTKGCLIISDNNFEGIPATNGSEALAGNAENAIRLIREKYPEALAIISSGNDNIPTDSTSERLDKPYRLADLEALLRRMGKQLQTPQAHH